MQVAEVLRPPTVRVNFEQVTLHQPPSTHKIFHLKDTDPLDTIFFSHHTSNFVSSGQPSSLLQIPRLTYNISSLIIIPSTRTTRHNLTLSLLQ